MSYKRPARFQALLIKYCFETPLMTPLSHNLLHIRHRPLSILIFKRSSQRVGAPDATARGQIVCDAGDHLDAKDMHMDKASWDSSHLRLHSNYHKCTAQRDVANVANETLTAAASAAGASRMGCGSRPPPPSSCCQRPSLIAAPRVPPLAARWRGRRAPHTGRHWGGPR